MQDGSGGRSVPDRAGPAATRRDTFLLGLFSPDLAQIMGRHRLSALRELVPHRRDTQQNSLGLRLFDGLDHAQALRSAFAIHGLLTLLDTNPGRCSNVLMAVGSYRTEERGFSRGVDTGVGGAAEEEPPVTVLLEQRTLRSREQRALQKAARGHRRHT